MPTYAVTLAGVPGRILPDVLTSLRQRYSDKHVFSGEGAKLYHDSLANYYEGYVTRLITVSAQTIFGHTNRPKGFCRNPGRGCALVEARNKSCARKDHQTCYLEKPGFFLFLYQVGHSQDAMLDRMHHSAFPVQLPQSCYNKAGRTVEEAVRAIQRSTPIINSLNVSLAQAKRALMLPPRNFGRGESLQNLFGAALRGEDLPPLLQGFRVEYYLKAVQAYGGRNRLAFRVGPHGSAGDDTRDDLALSKIFRLGCQYDNSLHWDVSRLDQKSFDGSISFYCRESGKRWPTGVNHMNVLVDDRLR
jgi:hypothetical protein